MERTPKRSYSGALAVLAALVLMCVLAGSSTAAPGSTSLVSVDSSGNPGNDFSGLSSISADGRYLAFYSSASNLVENDTNFNPDIFVRDLQEGTTDLVTVDSFGNQSSGAGGYQVHGISADGRYVVFFTSAPDLVADDTNNAYDFFVHDRQTGTTERVNVDSSENQSNGDNSSYSSKTVGAISADGRYVVFESAASDLVAGDTNDTLDVFIRDRQEGTTNAVSVDSSGNPGNGFSGGPSISADGHYVAFGSSASNLVENDTNDNQDIFVRDLMEGTTEMASLDNFGNPTISLDGYTTISDDGRYVAFTSSITANVFVRDRQTGLSHQVNLTDCATQANGGSNATISADGRYVAFITSDADFVTNIYVRDMQTGTIELVSVDNSGNPGNDFTFWPSISADGRYAAFGSRASNLVENDTNETFDVFVRDLLAGTTQDDDDLAPTTTACGHFYGDAPYEPGTWTNQDVLLTFSARDNEDGSGVKDIRYSAAGAQSLPESVYNTYDSSAIDTEGTTTISYFATDNAGNQESPAKTFTVKIDRTPPKVSATSPKNNATGVPLTANISATLSDSGSGIDPDSLIYDNISVVQVKPTGNVPVSGTLNYDEDSTTATFTPSKSLARGLYRATITGVTDKAGNMMPDYTWQFATVGPTKR